MIVKAGGKSKQILKFPCKDLEKCDTLTKGDRRKTGKDAIGKKEAYMRQKAGRRCAGCRKESCNGCSLFNRIQNPKDREVILPEDFVPDPRQGCGIAFDVGTTTLAALLFDLADGRQLGALTGVNPGRFAGADVISRITFAAESEENRERLQSTLIRKLDEMAEGLAGEKKISRVTVVGNTAMCESVLGLEMEGLCRAPFHKEYRGCCRRKGGALGFSFLKDAEILVLPSIDGYVGADALSVYTWVKAMDGRKKVLAVDIGTNGEILLFGEDRDFACSAAAGPALEGAAVVQGMGAVDGAIKRVALSGRFPMQDIACQVIGGGEAKGICGSGLISALSLFVRIGVIDESGYIRNVEEMRKAGTPVRICQRVREEKKTGERKVLLSGEDGRNPVFLTASDIRQLQLAKGAIRAGIDTLLQKAQIPAEALCRIYLTGSFGNSLLAEDVTGIGLLPETEKEKIISVSNCAGMGAAMALLSGHVQSQMGEDAEKICHIELAGEPDFQERFLQEMNFPASGR